MKTRVREVEVRVADDPRGGWLVSSPGIGWWMHPPSEGMVVGPGREIGFLCTLNRRVRLILPAGHGGRVLDLATKDRWLAVGFGQPLLRIAPAEGKNPALSSPADAAGLEAGTSAVVAPTDGVFYAAPTPGAPPFVRPGSRVRVGQPVGLVEVMKTFNQILYGGPGLPEEAEVLEIRCGDADEVHAGQVLIVVR